MTVAVCGAPLHSFHAWTRIATSRKNAREQPAGPATECAVVSCAVPCRAELPCWQCERRRAFVVLFVGLGALGAARCLWLALSMHTIISNMCMARRRATPR